MTTLRDALQDIYNRHGRLTAELVVKEATAETHPLHSRFTWDDEEAGEQWRHHQAAELIRSVKIAYREATDTEQARNVRAYHAVRGPAGYAYQPAETVAADPVMRALVLADMEREWKALHRRYQHFAEFLTMVRADLDEAD